jgi:predicted 2-oxoglutarate/Fe(II)-dependent dioxygenase YbiX
LTNVIGATPLWERLMSTRYSLNVGDYAPMIVGARLSGGFFALEAQLGRTVVLLVGDRTSVAARTAWLERFVACEAEFQSSGADVVMALTLEADGFSAHVAGASWHTVIAQPGLAPLGLNGRPHAPDVAVIDRAGRIVEVVRADDAKTGVELALQATRRLTPRPPQVFSAVAPVLIVPNLLDEALRKGLIAAFEAGDHRAGAMASINRDGAVTTRYDEAKKRRRDLELTPDHPLHAEVLSVLSHRLAPEIHKAFKVEVAHADRILIARYDDTGGYFHRHRDNVAPQVAFRQFAISLALNTGEYEGGDLEFPEFSDDLYCPAAGAALVFSASLLHAARPVTRGSRYVLLTFVHDQAAEVRRISDAMTPVAKSA